MRSLLAGFLATALLVGAGCSLVIAAPVGASASVFARQARTTAPPRQSPPLLAL